MFAAGIVASVSPVAFEQLFKNKFLLDRGSPSLPSVYCVPSSPLTPLLLDSFDEFFTFFSFLLPKLDEQCPFDTEHLFLQPTLCTVPGNYFFQSCLPICIVQFSLYLLLFSQRSEGVKTLRERFSPN